MSEPPNILTPVAAFLIALMVSVWVIPIMIRLAPRLGMIDKPDPRKVHRVPVARVGGIGIAIGAIAAILVFAPHDTFGTAFVIGSLILAFFGAWGRCTRTRSLSQIRRAVRSGCHRDLVWRRVDRTIAPFSQIRCRHGSASHSH